MSKVVIAVLIGAVLFVAVLAVRLLLRDGWRLAHQRVVGAMVLAYGIYLALLTGTVTQFALPGVGAIGAGAATGGMVGLAAYAVLGVVGIATGGTAFALGAGAMALVGAGVGAAGGAAGGFWFRTVSVPLVSPIFWVPVTILGIYWMIGWKRKRSEQ